MTRVRRPEKRPRKTRPKKPRPAKQLGHYLTWSLLWLLMVASRYLPLSWLVLPSRGLACLLLKVLPGRKRIALENLRLALGGETSEEQRQAILHRSIEGFVLGIVDLSKAAADPDRFLAANVAWEGMEHLEAALRSGRGAVLVGAHFVNFPLVVSALARTGLPVSSIVRNPSNPYVARFLDQFRDEIGLGYIHDKPKDACIRRALECLREKGVLFLQIDINVIAGGVYVDFFGRQVPTYTGPVVLAQRTGAEVLPIFGVRTGLGQHRAILGPPVALRSTGDKEADLQVNTALLSKVIEDFIRRFPEEWWWLHRRWRKAKE
ncbi:MAG: hypothetical protein HYY20_08490 [Candidatus Tectomicrobia bacterium]|uniref:Lipid A biosynthesis acyltransferase n=1 Tax=Tectimicrobiota bacterium TaxID=2528274 RepID=A0A932CP21_UNCTE|nr:hypothetical protein [Candidatus Tectomicrobia bacterium]